MNTQVEILVPKVTVGAESSFLNFMTLAESVALALNRVFWDSLEVLMGGTEDFDWLRAAWETLSSVLGDRSCIQNQKLENLFNNTINQKQIEEIKKSHSSCLYRVIFLFTWSSIILRETPSVFSRRSMYARGIKRFCSTAQQNFTRKTASFEHPIFFKTYRSKRQSTAWKQ